MHIDCVCSVIVLVFMAWTAPHRQTCSGGGGGGVCSRARTVCPCRVCLSRTCEVAPGLPQGGVDLRDGARILHFPFANKLERFSVHTPVTAGSRPVCLTALQRFNLAGFFLAGISRRAEQEPSAEIFCFSTHPVPPFFLSPTASVSPAVSQTHDTWKDNTDQESVLP